MNKLYKLISIMLATIAFAMPVMAENPYQVGDDAFVYDHYKTVIQQTPYQIEVCKQVGAGSGFAGDLGNMAKDLRGASTSDVLVGAIIGGVIGNQIGKGKGKDAATILGAILGADKANKNNSKTSTTGGTQCFLETRYKEISTEVYSHSTLKFKDSSGKRHEVDFIK